MSSTCSALAQIGAALTETVGLVAGGIIRIPEGQRLADALHPAEAPPRGGSRS